LNKQKGMATYITPFIREGILLESHPCPPTKIQADILANQLAKYFLSVRDEYRELVASTVDAKLGDTRFTSKEQVRLRMEGDTRIVDYPLLHLKNGHTAFDTRMCVAICTGGGSSKIWAGVRQPSNSADVMFSIPIEKLRNINPKYHTVASHSCAWLSKVFDNLFMKYLHNYDVKQKGQIEVSAYGVRDKGLAMYFNKLCETNISMTEILQDKKANDKLSFYFERISDVSDDLYHSTITKGSEKYSWYTSQVMVEVNGGYIKPRQALFLRSFVDGNHKYVGLVYDDSVNRNLSHLSVKNVAKYLGTQL